MTSQPRPLCFTLLSSPVEEGQNGYELLTKSKPINLPLEYHQSLLHLESEDGTFFAAAGVTVLFNEVHGVEFWKAIEDNYISKNREAPQDSGFMQFMTFPNNAVDEIIDERIRYEYLLDPCVLLQLPFFPATFRQWLDEVNLQVLALYNNEEDFFKPMPENEAEVALQCLKLLMKIKDLLACGYQILKEQVKIFPKVDPELTEFIQRTLLPTFIPVIEIQKKMSASYASVILDVVKYKYETYEIKKTPKEDLRVLKWQSNSHIVDTSQDTRNLLLNLMKNSCENLSKSAFSGTVPSSANYSLSRNVQQLYRNVMINVSGISNIKPFTTEDLLDQMNLPQIGNKIGTSVAFTAEKLQNKIRLLVRDMFKKIACEKRYTSASIQIWQWNQYILPCFASSLLLAQRSENFKIENLDILAQLIDKIIDSFEAYFLHNLDREIYKYEEVDDTDKITLVALSTLKNVNLWQVALHQIHLLLFNDESMQSSFEYEKLPPYIHGLTLLSAVLTPMLTSMTEKYLKDPLKFVINWAKKIPPCMLKIQARFNNITPIYMWNILQAVRLVEIERATSPLMKDMLMIYNFLYIIQWHLGDDLHDNKFWLILTLAHKKIHSSKQGIPWILKKGELMFKIESQHDFNFVREANELSFESILYLTLYYVYDYFCRLTEKKGPSADLVHQIQDRISCLDGATKELASYFLKKDWFRVRMFLMPKFYSGKDFSPLEFHKLRTQLPRIQESLSSAIRGRKVAMEKPGQLTMIPLKHCRWCGELRAKLKMCELCAGSYKDYPDLTWYCEGRGCQEMSLDQDHQEEHAQYIVMLLEKND